MLAFLCVSINSIASQSTGNIALAALYDCKIMIAIVCFSYYFFDVDVGFFHSCFTNFSEISLLVSLVWNV